MATDAGKAVSLTLLCGALAVLGGTADAQAPDVGSDIASPAVLARLFHGVCVGAASLDAAEAVLESVGMVSNPETGTWFHQQFDMSVNPSGGICSIVFAATDEAAATAEFLQSVAAVDAAGAGSVEIVRLPQVSETYLRAALPGRWP
jgi:hypothetical protein